MKLAVLTTRMSAINTFLERDLRGLMSQGITVDLWLWTASGLPDSLAAEIESHGGAVRLVPRPWSARAALDLAREAVVAPARLLRSAGIALSCFASSAAEGAIALGCLPSAIAMGRALPGTGAAQVHALWAGTPTSLAYWIGRHAGIPYGFSAHAWDIQGRTRLLARKVAAAKGVVVCSRHAYERLREIASPGGADKIRLVHHGLDLSSWRSEGGRRLDDPPLLLAVGRLTPKKGFEDLVQACARLAERGRAFRCEIVGPEWRSGPQLRSRIAELGLTDRVRTVGALPLDEVRRRMEAASVFVSPSVTTAAGESDGIPNVVLEAMSLEIPVVATDAGGLPEVVRDGATGTIVPQRDAARLADAIDRVLADPAGARDRARAGRLLVEASFDGTATARQLLVAIGLAHEARPA